MHIPQINSFQLAKNLNIVPALYVFYFVRFLTGKHSPMIATDIYQIIMTNTDKLNSAIIYDRDFKYQYFGFKTLERSYLLKIDGM